MTSRVYPSAYDWWLLVLLYSAPTLSLVLAVAGYQQGRPDLTGTCLLLALALVLLNLAMTWPCRYTLTGDTLNIRCGLMCRSLPLSRIVRAEPSGSWESAPAMSLRRVKLVLDKGHRVISPADRDDFLRDLTAALARHHAAT